MAYGTMSLEFHGQGVTLTVETVDSIGATQDDFKEFAKAMRDKMESAIESLGFLAGVRE
ncbi:hypothetical protein SEA_JUMBO_46 [Gordonia phage Jumbo]|uniref:Uncharacterized protein n=1 Tax=Gordonia phage Jumbo TaxID=1887650 RepID=A0A1B3B0Q2_9CAUD|nr:hypothetical protein BIZ69_gp046 [Gordonia phage Jumbo]AOE44556.1 hypothetical protein SEA_JUMBO_46 [Gordonia phage Jumbo]